MRWQTRTKFWKCTIARNLFERTLENQATRLATVASLTKKSLSDITDEDIPQNEKKLKDGSSSQENKV